MNGRYYAPKAESSQLGGNGDGYTGKLDGLYASLDVLNTCGKNTNGVYKVKDEVKVVGQEMYYTTKNCTPLTAPELISSPKVTAEESSGAMFVMDIQMFQRGAFVQVGEARSYEFVDYFCSGWDTSDPQPGIKRLTEVAMYRGTQSIVSIPLLFDQMIRRGRLRLIDISRATDRIVSVQSYEFDPIMQTSVNDSFSGTRVLSLYNIDGPHDFNMNYVEVDGLSPFVPTQLDYAINGGPDRSALPLTCWHTY